MDSISANNSTLNLDVLIKTFDPLLEGIGPTERQRDHLYGLANIFDLKSARDRAEPAVVWRDLRDVLLRQRLASEDGDTSGNVEPMTVLVVEDDPDIAGQLVEGLVSAGHHVVGPAANAGVGAALADLHAIDVALIDINLAADGDGVALARQLRGRWDLKVVFLSGDVSAMANNAAECDAFIIKPYRTHDVLRTLEELAA